MSVKLEVGKSYNFSTIAAITLGENYTNVKLTAVVDFKLASKFKDVVSIYNAIKNEISVPIVYYKNINYYIFTNEDNEEVVMATDWLRDNSVVEITKLDGIFKVSDINSEDLNIIRDAIQALGYQKLEVEIDKIGE